MKKALSIALLAMITGAHAASHLGIEVYPGAKEDAAVAKQVKQKLKIDAHTYRTADDVAKVTDFYRKQNLTQKTSTKKGASFSGTSATVTVQSPWLDLESGQLNKDTLISIAGK